MAINPRAVVICGLMLIAVGCESVVMDRAITDHAVVTAAVATTTSDTSVRASDYQEPPRQRPDAIVAKGIYLNAGTIGQEATMDHLLDLLDTTELNTVVVDIKDASGYVFYPTAQPTAVAIKATKPLLGDLAEMVKMFHDRDVYVIARLVVFQDPVLAAAKPEWAIKVDGGGLWQDYKGQSWVDPTVREVWDYNFDLAAEAVAAGVDEINFDYVRFPSDGPVATARYQNWEGSRIATMQQFYKAIDERLGSEPVWLGVDFFGLTLDNVSTGFDLNIGQRIVDVRDVMDYVYPMSYPSHYPDGYAGWDNPADHPYEVIAATYARNSDVLATSTTKFRTWLQAFDIGAVYDGPKIRAQIKAAEAASSTAGWVLWNARSRYGAGGLQPESSASSD